MELNFLHFIGVFLVIFSIIFNMNWFGILGLALIIAGFYFDDNDL